MIRSLITFSFVLGVSACYGPTPKDGAFKCAAETNYACPEGQRCEPSTGLCVSNGGQADLLLRGDGGVPTVPAIASTCDDHVRFGAFTNPRLLGGASSSADDQSLALSPTGDRIYFVSTRSGTPAYYTAAIDPAVPATANTVELVTLSNPALVPGGGSFATDGSLWFAGTAAGTTQLYSATASPANTLTIAQTLFPSTTMCPFYDPFLADANPAGELYVAFPLAGCAKSTTIAAGHAGLQIGAFYGAVVASPGFSSPTLLPGSLTLLASSVETTRRVHYAVRPSLEVQFSNPVPIARAGWSSDAASDRQLVIRNDCKVAYLVSARPGGTGANDLWVLDITP